MGMVLLDKNVGRGTRPQRPSSPGSHILWWEQLRGALSSIAALARRTAGRGDRGHLAFVPPGNRGAGRAGTVLPGLPSIYDHTAASLGALARVNHQVVAQSMRDHTPAPPPQAA